MQTAFNKEAAYTSLALRFFRNSLVLLPEAEATHAGAREAGAIIGLRLHQSNGAHADSVARQHRPVVDILQYKHTTCLTQAARYVDLMIQLQCCH